MPFHYFNNTCTSVEMETPKFFLGGRVLLVLVIIGCELVHFHILEPLGPILSGDAHNVMIPSATYYIIII